MAPTALETIGFYLFYIQLLSDQAFLYLDVQFMQALVYRIRHREHGDVDAVIKGHPLAFCIKDARYFLQFDATVVVDGELQRLIGWGHPRLIGLLKCGPTHLFIDGTFRIVPCGWYQMLVIPSIHPLHTLYTPSIHPDHHGVLHKT